MTIQPVRPFRVAFLVSHPVQYHVPLFRALAARGDVDLTVYFCSTWGSEEFVDPQFGRKIKWDLDLLSGYRHVFLRNIARRAGPDRPWGLFNPGIMREIWANRYDALIVHGYAHATNWLAFFAGWTSRTPLIFRAEAVLRPYRPWWVRALKRSFLGPLFRNTRAFLTIGSRSRDFYSHFGVTDERMFFTPYAVDNAFFIAESDKWRRQKDELKQQLGVAGKPVILFVGKLFEKKRPRDLLAAFSSVRDEAALVFVGDGEQRSELEQTTNEADLANVRFAGFVNQSELPKYYALADLFVLPSSNEEVSPLVINEAMCCGLPVVVSDAVPSAIDFVREGENGHLFHFGDVDQLGRVLQSCVRSPERRAAMGERGRAMIREWDVPQAVAGTLRAIGYVGQR